MLIFEDSALAFGFVYSGGFSLLEDLVLTFQVTVHSENKAWSRVSFGPTMA